MEKLPSDQIRYPSHSWGVFALDPAIDVGITGEALARSAFASSGIDIEKLKVRAQQDDVKKRLIDLTTDAVNRGAFGSPSFFVGRELFFGKDQLRDVEESIVEQTSQVISRTA
jgi:2-hydroxychromene-2-carboxylate isomerase